MIHMTQSTPTYRFGDPVAVTSAPVGASVLLVCEHASNHVPARLNNLGLSAATLAAHVAWDPGALGVSRALADILHAPLVEGKISRLVYDLNRPPVAPTAMPIRSEVYDIPGNVDLSDTAKDARVLHIYEPFRSALTTEIETRRSALKLLVTVHSFTPTYNGTTRAVELGLLHGHDARFANAMLASIPDNTPWDTRLNEPYSATDGVAHTLNVHGCENGLLNVMLEIRNDLIETPSQQQDWAQFLAPWLMNTLKGLE